MRTMGRVRVVLLTAIGLGAGLGFAERGTAVGTVEAQESGQNPKALARGLGIHFAVIPVAGNARPLLPDGTWGIRRSRAIAIAERHAPGGVGPQAGSGTPTIRVTAQFGLFTDTRFGRGTSKGRLHLFLKDRPVWVVTFSGPGIEIPPAGPVKGNVMHHEVSVVIDAKTGRYWMGYSYR
jgi:hypothetical protein